jgi:hypothetical protein
MDNPKLVQQKNEMDSLFGQISVFAGDPYVKSLLTYYLCVRVSGFVENCVRIILADYSTPRTQDHVRTFVEVKLDRFPNPTFDQICKAIADFNDQWNRDFKTRIPAPVRASLRSINVNRNQIAHGGTSTITIGQLQKYYQDAIFLIEELEGTCQ